jgi:hypothetical protein
MFQFKFVFERIEVPFNMRVEPDLVRAIPEQISTVNEGEHFSCGGKRYYQTLCNPLRFALIRSESTITLKIVRDE